MRVFALNISPYILALTETQRAALGNILTLISGKKKVRASDLNGFINDESCTGVRIQKCFGVTRVGLGLWVGDGCPRNPDGSYSIPAVYKWRVEKISARHEQPVGLKEEKLKKEIEFLQTRINEKNDSTMDRALHETILTARAGSLRSFFEKTFMSNSVHLAGKTVDEVRTVLYDLLKQAMDTYLGKGD
jgi:hypothetical protein